MITIAADLFGFSTFIHCVQNCRPPHFALAKRTKLERVVSSPRQKQGSSIHPGFVQSSQVRRFAREAHLRGFLCISPPPVKTRPDRRELFLNARLLARFSLRDTPDSLPAATSRTSARLDFWKYQVQSVSTARRPMQLWPTIMDRLCGTFINYY